MNQISMKVSKNKKSSKSNLKFFDLVYKITSQIPYGKVTTYGHIAEFCGIKSAARTVGWALNDAKDTGLPCHRVVNRFGALTGKLHFGDPKLMEEMLRAEGIEFNDKNCVVLEKYLWVPQIGRNKSKKRKR